MMLLSDRANLLDALPILSGNSMDEFGIVHGLSMIDDHPCSDKCENQYILWAVVCHTRMSALLGTCFCSLMLS